MAHLIDKDALVAEIEKLKDEYLKHSRNKFHAEWSCGTLDNILSFLDTLEVKDVDLEKEINNFGLHYDGIVLDRKELIETAKHFFELGLRSTITEEDCKLIWNIGDDLPCMPEEDFFKELLRRYKAQKGE